MYKLKLETIEIKSNKVKIYKFKVIRIFWS